MEIECDREEEKINKNALDKLELKYISTDVIQNISNNKNNDFYDPVSLDLGKKQNSFIRNICFNKCGLKLMTNEDNFEGRPGDFLREEIKLRKFFIENQSSFFESDNARVKSIKQHLIENNLRKLNKYINLVNLIKSKDFDSNMKNNLAFYKFIMNNPFLKILEEEVFKELYNKYSHLSIDVINSQMKNNTAFKYTDNSYTNDNLLDEENEYDDYNEDEEIYDSGDDVV